MDSFFSPSQFNFPKIFAHRGASFYKPENTILSFEHAHDLKAKGIEFDCWLTKDHHIVVLHDECLSKFGVLKKHINHTLLNEVQKLDAGTWFAKEYAGAKVPTLNEVFECIQNKNFLKLIEIKDENLLIVDKLNELIKKFKLQCPFFILSQHLHILKYLNEKHPQYSKALVLDRPISTDDIANAKTHNIPVFVQNHLYLDKGAFELLKEHKIEVLSYTVNDLSICNQLSQTGKVQSFISDKPDLFLSY